MDSYRTDDSNSDDICDIRDGTEYKKIKSHLQGQYDIVLLWNTDGVSLSSSSKQQLWPILSTICEVPPRLRSSFIIVSGIHVGNCKPDMNIFLKPFVNCLQCIFNKGGVKWTHPQTNESCSSMVVAPALSADAPARAISLKVMQYNSRYGCNTCEQKTERVEINQDNSGHAKSKKKKIKRCYVYQENAARLRNGIRMERQGTVAEKRGKPRKGVISKATISDIPFLDRACCVSAEYLHTVLLGVVKYILNRVLFVKGGPWYIGHKRDEIDNFISTCIKVPDYIKRVFRKFSDFKFFKASEFRAFLLFYSLPIFKEHMSQQYFQHWLLLVSALHILLGEAISERSLASAEIMLRCFVRDLGKLYGNECDTYNVHNLLHLCLLVKRWGPLWATSAFPYENFNGFISTHVHGTKHLGVELLNNIKITQSMLVLENSIRAPTLYSPREKPTNVKFLGKPVDNHLLHVDEQRALSGFGNCVLYSRVKFGTERFTSKVYDSNKRRANSFVKYCQIVDGKNAYGEVLYFVEKEDKTVHCLVKVLKVAHVDLFVHEQSRFTLHNFLPIEGAYILSTILFNQIILKVLKVGKYLCIPPNTYEINL